MTTYTATLAHSSISRAPQIKVSGTLAAAKRAATGRFGDGFQDHEIRIHDEDGDLVASRRVGDRRWTDRA